MTKKQFPFFTANPDIIYLDSGATAQKPQSVLNAEIAHYIDCNAPTGRSLYPMAKNATEAFDQARETMKNFLGATDVSSIVFTSGTTNIIRSMENTSHG